MHDETLRTRNAHHCDGETNVGLMNVRLDSDVPHTNPASPPGLDAVCGLRVFFIYGRVGLFFFVFFPLRFLSHSPLTTSPPYFVYYSFFCPNQATPKHNTPEVLGTRRKKDMSEMQIIPLFPSSDSPPTHATRHQTIHAHALACSPRL